ncbi:hypothetical protein HYC85_010944 [Camellia sinensis]|uniref:Uncharacterized protein n=1 Tax=Camellia sinensis TaxID=4442 RepID=A0A7J7HJC3_CAMSI|nr:hypothetical protein HYC85_010944 [Camellia sinensis]
MTGSREPTEECEWNSYKALGVYELMEQEPRLGDKEDKYKYLARIQMVHIDDVTNAHIPRISKSNIGKKNNISIITPIYFCSALKEIECFTPPHLSSKKLLDTGFKFKYDLEEVYDETIRCCEEKGFL